MRSELDYRVNRGFGNGMDSQSPRAPWTGILARHNSDIVDITFDEVLTPEAAERSLAAARIEDRRSIRLDLAQCRWLDVVALLSLVGVTARRKSAGRLTRYKLPHDSGAREFLRRRGFAAAIEDVTDVPFRLLVDDNWFQGPRESMSDAAPFVDASATIHAYLDDHRFFWFSHYRATEVANRVAVIEREGRKWQDPLLRAFLGGLLSEGQVNDVLRVIVREMLTNFINPNFESDMFCVSSIDWRTAPVAMGPSLVIAVWRGDLPLIEQFMAMVDGPRSRDAFEIAFRKTPGRTGNLAHKGRKPREAGQDESATATPGGTMTDYSVGLEALYRCVIDEFDGRLSLMSGKKSAEVSKAPANGPRYLLNIRHDPHGVNLGSIISVRLPLKNE